MTFIVKIDCDNAAFGDSPDMEVVRILRELAVRIWKAGLPEGGEMKLFDVNGNAVGFAATRLDSVED